MTHWTAAQARAAIAHGAVVTLDTLCAPGAVLLAAPHPDDESLGCGGLIALAADAGRTVVVAVLTDGGGSHPRSRRFPPSRLATLREAEVREAVALLDQRAVVVGFGAPDGGLAAHELDAADWLARLGEAYAVTTICTTWEADQHADHKSAFRAASKAARACGAGLLAYPVWGLTLPDVAPAGAAAPCLRLDVSNVLERKARAVAAHRSQVSGLIDDDPQGFRLSPEDIARHLQPFEPYLRIR